MLKLTIETKNNPFKDDLRSEAIRCMKFVIDKIDNYDFASNIIDTNGNNVGYFKLMWKK